MAILEEGVTADTIGRASRLSFLIDADAYFRAFASAVTKARRWVGALAWDVDSRVHLGAGGWSHGPLPERLGPFLDAVVRAREPLEVHLLSWAPAAIYAFERELGVRVKLGWGTHERLHFDLDDTHAPTACHHQKVVVVDDVLGFVGGIDLTGNRWDTPAHAPHDERRVTPRGKPYGPFHDAQVAVSGPVCGMLGNIVRDRWARHRGEHIEPPPLLDEVWPAHLPVDMRDVEVGVVLTDPLRGNHRCTETLLVRAVLEARESIYIENQYLTSRSLSEALSARLSEKGGPEVIIVAPRRCEGWLEESTMGVLRAEVLADLVSADREERLRAVYPIVEPHPVFVHSKLMIVDGAFVYLGSANFTDRSLGFDTECGLAVEAGGREDIRRAISCARDRLLGEHLGEAPAAIARHVAQGGTLRSLIDAHRDGPRRVAPLEDLDGTPLFEWAASFIPMGRPLVDPPEPMELGHAITEILERREDGRPGSGRSMFDEEDDVGEGGADGRRSTREGDRQARAERGAARRRLLVLQLAPLLLLVLAGLALWGATPLGTLTVYDVQAELESWRERPMAFLLVLGAYLAGALMLAPLNLLQAPVVIAFGPWLGPLYALVGALLSASLSYAVGRLLGRRPLAKLGGEDVQRAASQLSGSGVLAVFVARHVPLAPYPIINLVAGALEVRFSAYFFGTLLGLLPGIVALAIVGQGLWEMLEEGVSARAMTLAVSLAAIALGSAYVLARWLKRRMAESEAEAEGG